MSLKEQSLVKHILHKRCTSPDWQWEVYTALYALGEKRQGPGMLYVYYRGKTFSKLKYLRYTSMGNP